MLVSVECMHHTELGRADSDYDNRAGEVRHLDDELLSLVHVVDGAVGQDQEDLIGVLSIPCSLFGILLEGREHLTEVGRTRQVDRTLLDPLSIHLHDILDARDFRVSWVGV